jgi:enoyl-CoA hydratase/carnithine racemase
MEYFDVKDLNSIRKITIINPKKKNALNRRAYIELGKLLNEAGNDSKIKCVLITGHGDFYR